MGKYMDMLNEQWDKCHNLATYAFNISLSSENVSSPYSLVFGKEPLDAELQELEELHHYSGSNCGLKQLQQLKEIWRAHANNLYGMSKARKSRFTVDVQSHNHVLRNRETLNVPDRLTY